MSQSAALPSAEDQVRFLSKLQRLLEETRTTSSYKFALLRALADLSVERGDGSGAALPLSTDQIARKFIAYYWQHTLPYATPSGSVVLRQNTDRPARVLTDLQEARVRSGDSVTSILSNRRIIASVERTVRTMPLGRLQKVGKGRLEFLYEHAGQTRHIQLRPGVTFCFRRFHGLIQDLVCGAWLRFVRELNVKQLGSQTDLADFLFGVRRPGLTAARRALEEVEEPRCFYCGRRALLDKLQVDHFIPWRRYPASLGHNFVLSDLSCNSAKGDRLPSITHLEKWRDRNLNLGNRLERFLESYSVPYDLAATTGILHWAYEQTEASEGLTWERGERMVPLDPGWRRMLAVSSLPL